MSLQFSVLASGSTGNALYLETDDHAFLVDAGLSGKAMEGLMAQIDRKLDQLDGIFVTHEHSDHIKGLGVLARKYELPVYANEKTWKAMEGHIGKMDNGQKFVFPMETVKSFSAPRCRIVWRIPRRRRADVLCFSLQWPKARFDYGYGLCQRQNERHYPLGKRFCF